MEKRKGNVDFELPFGRFSLLFRANGVPNKVYEVVSVTDRANNGSELPEGWRKEREMWVLCDRSGVFLGL